MLLLELPCIHTAKNEATHCTGRRYSQGGALIEVNAHSLFSKWFSESGKLVSRLFTKIRVGTRWAGGAHSVGLGAGSCCCA